MHWERHALGREGERLAAEHLERAGYRIVGRNVRAGGVELDLVVRRGRTLAFVEVKSRQGRSFGRPEEAVDARKQARIARGAGAWLHAHRPGAVRVRFDVVVVEPDAEGALTVRHWPAAFDAPPARPLAALRRTCRNR